jgi:nucleotide-binding universal stress UspA family protein
MAGQRLLVGFDGSPGARAALQRAAELARNRHGCLTVVLVVDRTWSAICSGLAPVAAGVAVAEAEAAAFAELRRAIDELPPDVSVRWLICRGPAGAALAREARRSACDTIVIGAPRSLLSRLTGGVRGYLRRHSGLPLVVVRTRRSGFGAARVRS